jgi:putative endonuclease
MEPKSYYVYILTNWNNKVMYIGVTGNLQQRIYQHKNKLIDGFTKKYNITKLVYHEEIDDVISAITREKQLKNWTREKKNKLVKAVNPKWKDLGLELI